MEADLSFFSVAWWEIFLGGVCTFAIFSFLYKENFFYRFFEHLFIGIATGYGVVIQVREFLWPRVLKPFLGFDRVFFPDGTVSEPYNKAYLLYLLPMIFGSLYYFILSKRHSWIAQVVIGFGFGIAGGLAFKATFSEMLPQVYDSFRPLYVRIPTINFAALTWVEDILTRQFTLFEEIGSIASAHLLLLDSSFSWSKTISNCIFVFTLLTALSYFFFTFSRKAGGLIEKSSIAGRWMLMGCFGAFFGSTIMARMALLVERVDFLTKKWWPSITGLF